MDTKLPMAETSEAALASGTYMTVRIEEQIEVGPEPVEQTVEGSYAEFEADMLELRAAVNRDFASFDQLTTARDYIDNPKFPADKRNEVIAIYPKVLAAFEKGNGRLVNIYTSAELRCYVGLTAPKPTSRFERFIQRLNIFDTQPPGEASFYFFYDLSKAGADGAPLLARVDQLWKEAPRLLSGSELSACVDRLYSTATDLAAVLEPSRHPHGQPGRQAPGAATTKTEHDSRDGTNLKADDKPAKRADLLAVIAGELDALELRYLKTPARSRYFGGAVVGVGMATFVALFGLGYGLDLILLQMWLAGALGAMLSIIQRLNDDKLDVKYDVGPAAVSLTGTLRPILGGFAGLLTLLLVLSRIVPLPVGTGNDGIYLVVLALVAGFAERSVPDIISKAQNAVGKAGASSADGSHNPVSQSST